MKNYRRKSFNCVELCCVVSILSAAVAVLLPAEIRAQQKLCEDKLRQMGQAAQVYAADNGGWLPFSGLDWPTKNKLGGKMDAWIDGSAPSRNIDRFVCPADDVPLDKRQSCGNKIWLGLEGGGAAWAPISYGVNLVISGAPNNQYCQPHTLKSIEQPKDCFLVADATTRDICEKSRFSFRHDKKTNAVFVDGHTAELDEAAIPVFKSNLTQSFWVGGGDE